MIGYLESGFDGDISAFMAEEQCGAVVAETLGDYAAEYQERLTQVIENLPCKPTDIDAIVLSMET